MLQSWTNSDPCTADYVNCSATGQVTSIVLPSLLDASTQQWYPNFLSGYVFPEAFSIYTALQILQLDNTPLDGQIPVSYSRLTSLQLISGRYNRMSGSLPEEWSTLVALTSVSFVGTPFWGAHLGPFHHNGAYSPIFNSSQWSI